MTAYYNEIDPHAAAWLRELIAEGHIANGVVDTRSIEDVLPSDLAGFAQCHFFAGIGGWSLALRLAGWPDERPVWTGSCPCQPFSSAGQGAGFADERHLWPAFFHLIRQRRPDLVFGEQVANALPWLDLVQTDLEGEGYASGAAIIGAHSVGAPHIRQRLYWVGHADSAGLQTRNAVTIAGQTRSGLFGQSSLYGELAYTPQPGGRSESEFPRPTFVGVQIPPRDGPSGELGHASGGGSGRDSGALPGEEGSTQRSVRSESHEPVTAGWANCDWLPCRDGKRRPVEAGTFPLAHGVPGRVGLLRGYGNAIVPQVAAKFIEAFDTLDVI